MRDARLAVQPVDRQGIETVSRPTQFEYPAAGTLTKNEVCACIEDTGVVPAAGVGSAEDTLFAAIALIEAGIPILEISANAPDAVEIVSYVVKHAPTTIVGGGSLRNAAMAQKFIDAGVKFLATDGLIPSVTELAGKENLATVSGALTLTEVLTAWDTGSDFVKVVPCYAVGGHKYIRTLKESIPQARLIAAGGVNQLTAQNYIEAGAAALGLGGELIPAEAIALRQSRRIGELARRFLTAVDKGRS